MHRDAVGAKFSGQIAQTALIAIDERQPRSLSCEGAGSGQADATGSARDEDDLSMQTCVHSVPPASSFLWTMEPDRPPALSHTGRTSVQISASGISEEVLLMLLGMPIGTATHSPAFPETHSSPKATLACPCTTNNTSIPSSHRYGPSVPAG